MRWFLAWISGTVIGLFVAFMVVWVCYEFTPVNHNTLNAIGFYSGISFGTLGGFLTSRNL